MTNLSDEDRAAITYLRNLMDGMPSLGRVPLERVLALAGEEPVEPDDGTFWFDPQDRIVYQRDDLENPGHSRNWYATGRSVGKTWQAIGSARQRLVQLVPKGDEPQTLAAGRYQEVLMELLGARETWHQERCGGKECLSKCTYRDCKAYWIRLHSLGVRAAWESVES